MGRILRIISMLLAVTLALSGCAMVTLEDLYCLPKRSEENENLQAVIDKAMVGLEYAAPLSGDNRQVRQIADLDGDGIDEYLLFTKDDSEKPLKILIFCQLASGYVLMDTIEGYGFAFDFVSYAQMDDKPGVELIVGRQVSDQVMGSVSVYRFTSGFSRQLMSTGYSQLITTDLDVDGICELFVLTSGVSEKSNGIARLYTYNGTELQRSSEIQLSAPVNGFKQMITGKMDDGKEAVYVTCIRSSDTLATDIFALDRGEFVSLYSDITMAALHNYYLYPEDVDNDDVLELPSLVEIPKLSEDGRQEYIIAWNSLSENGDQTLKRCDYYNFVDNWYLEVEREIASQLSVVQTEDGCEFYYNAEKVLTIAALMDADRVEQSQLPGWYTLYATDTVIYVANLETIAAEYVSPEVIIARFSPIRVEINTEKDG